jgi:hypothetical protein
MFTVTSLKRVRLLGTVLSALVATTWRTTAASAQPPAPTQASVVGVVVSSTTGDSLSGATVELQSTRFTRRLRTEVGGRFRFTAIPAGGYRLTVLRLGYQPISQPVTVTDADADLRIAMQPDARTLNAIVTNANVTAIFGGIGAAGLSRNANGERGLLAVRGARVQVLGSGAETETDSLGRFFLELKKPGRYLVRATSPGLVPQVYSVDVPRNKAADASRLLDSATTMESERPEYLWKEMDRRMNTRGINSAIVTGDEVREYGGALSTALQRSQGMNERGLRLGAGPMCVFVDGIHRPNLPLDAIRPEEIEAIEVYGVRGDPTSSLVNSAKGKGCPGASTRQTSQNPVQFVVIWTVR